MACRFGTLLTLILIADVDSTQQTVPTEPVMESYAMTEILSVKDKKKDKKVCICMYIYII